MRQQNSGLIQTRKCFLITISRAKHQVHYYYLRTPKCLRLQSGYDLHFTFFFFSYGTIFQQKSH